KHKWVKGLGIIPYLHCPHYDEPERAGFDEFYSGQITDAIAIENQVAIVWDNYEFYVIKSNPVKNAYMFSWSDTGLNKKVLL
ncbi:MAG TPA: peptidase E, partial [Clostridiaceae bacterium]|nr:peptidase E [Clostridiaceae bacterium]